MRLDHESCNEGTNVPKRAVMRNRSLGSSRLRVLYSAADCFALQRKVRGTQKCEIALGRKVWRVSVLQLWGRMGRGVDDDRKAEALFQLVKQVQSADRGGDLSWPLCIVSLAIHAGLPRLAPGHRKKASKTL